MKSVNLKINIKLSIIAMLSLFVVACGGPVAYTNTSTAAVATVITGTLSATSTSIPYSSSTTLTWSSANTTPCTFSGDSSTGTSGTFITPRLTTATTYTLTCGSVSQSVTIKVATSAIASAITAFADAGSGNVTVTTINALSNGTQITISGTTHYNGTYTVANQTGTNFTIVATFNGDDATGAWQLAGGIIYGCSTQGTTVGLSAINLSTYSATRYTGVAPLSVTLDASDTTTDGTVTQFPFHEIEYRWDFGDVDPVTKALNLSPPAPLVGGTSTWNMGSKPNVNSRNAATGPVAAHVFETPGVYTIALTATDGKNTVKNSCVQVVVQNPDTVFAGANTICIASGSTPVAGIDGCPLGAAVYQQADFAAAVNTYIGTGKRLLFKHDDTFAEAGNASISKTGPGIIGMYGTGAKPLILSTAKFPIILGYGSVLSMQDWRVMDLEFNGQSSTNSIGVATGGDADQITLLRLNMHDMGSGISLDADVIQPTAGTHIFDQFTVADSTFNRFIGSIGWYIYANHLVLLGNFVNDTTGGTAQHVVRIMHSAKGVISNNTFGNPSPTHQSFTLRGVSYSNVNCTGGVGTGQCLPGYFPYGSYAALTSQTVVSDNHFISGNTQQPVTVEPSDINYFDTRFQDILLERNWYTATAGGSCCLPMLKITAQDVTVRNEVMDMTTGGTGVYKRGIAIQGAGTVAIASNNVRVYNNTVFGNDSFDFQPVQVQSGATNVVVVNNLFYSPNISTTVNTTNAVVASNNSTTTNKSPYLATVPPTNPAGFKITAGSYAIGAGAAVPVWSDFFLTPITATSTRDMGAVIH